MQTNGFSAPAKINLYDCAIHSSAYLLDKTVIEDIQREELGQFIVNHEKMLYVDKAKCRDNDGWIVHPLPILTCSGNGRGGGDYRPFSDRDASYIGTWAGNSISIEFTAPVGYKELIPDFYDYVRIR